MADDPKYNEECPVCRRRKERNEVLDAFVKDVISQGTPLLVRGVRPEQEEDE